MNFVIYGVLISFISFYLYMVVKREKQIRNERQKVWDRLKQVFNTSEADERKIYNLYCNSVPRHWFLGYVYPIF